MRLVLLCLILTTLSACGGGACGPDTTAAECTPTATDNGGVSGH